MQNIVHGWYVRVALLVKLILQTVMKLPASVILPWTTLYQFSSFRGLKTFRLLSKIRFNIILTQAVSVNWSVLE